MPPDQDSKLDLRHPPVSLRPKRPVQQHRCLDGHPLQTVSANDGSACSMPSHDAGKTRFAPIRSLGKNLPPGRSPPDHDDEPQLQFLRSWNQSITAETHLTDVVGQTDTIIPSIQPAPRIRCLSGNTGMRSFLSGMHRGRSSSFAPRLGSPVPHFGHPTSYLTIARTIVLKTNELY
jgi:hypothetical protein